MYTSCPECGTVFRIATNDLRVAEGYVRCGHCSATFNAVATLSDEPPHSATLISRPEPEPPIPPADVAVAARSDDTLEFNIPEGNWSDFFRGDELSEGRQEPPDLPAADTDTDTDTDTEATDTSLEPPAPDVDDDWQALLDEVQDAAATDSVYIIETDTLPDVPEESVPADTPWDEPALEATRTPAPLPVDFAANLTPDHTAADADAGGLGSDVDPDNGQATPETPNEPGEHPPFAWTPPDRVGTDPPRRRWVFAAGSALLAVALIIQVLHQRRDELATNPAFTEALQRVYGALKIPLWPAWDLRAYEIRNYEAVADRSSRGALDILARIAVVGDNRVGLPLVRVTLTDRFGQPMGSRVLKPDEYLGKNSRPREPVSPGTLIPVEIRLKDPGTDAQGFDVDICLMNQRDGMTCQSEREPFAR